MSMETEHNRLWSTQREKQQAPAEKVLPLKAPPFADREGRHYTAFETCDRAERLYIKRATRPSRRPSYNYLLDIVYDDQLDNAFSLIYTFMVVEVTGANLGGIVHAIGFGTCERIRQYHPKLYDRPASPDEPFIESIEITAADEMREG